MSFRHRSRRFLSRRPLQAGIALIASLAIAAPAAAASGDLDPTFGASGIAVTRPDGRAQAVGRYPGGGYVSAGLVQREGILYFALTKLTETGALDPTFSVDGVVRTGFFGSDGFPLDASAYGVAVQSDGKIVAVGEASSRYALARYLPNGSLDPAFGTGGRVITGIGGLNVARDVALLPSGKLLVAGEGNFEFAVARFLEDGSLDATFDGDGVVTTPIKQNQSRAASIAISPDRSIVLAGGIEGFDVVEGIAVARYLPDGTLDTSFSQDGIVVTRVQQESFADEVTVGADGSVLACGHSFVGAAQRYDFVLARYEPDGDPDPTFSVDGRLRTDWGSVGAGGGCTGLAWRPDAIVASGHVDFLDVVVARYLADGTLDPSFGTGGRVRTPFDSVQADDLVVDAGRLVVAGGAVRGTKAGFTLVRYIG
jgi:uncharacterized delta-60 repeat protein